MENNKAPFFPTEALKKAHEQKPITSYLPENDGRDPNPMWEDVARSVWPATRENQTSREALADVLMWAVYDETILSASPNAGIAMSRMIQRLVGSKWTRDWLRDNRGALQRRIKLNRQEYGGFKRMFKNFFK